MSLSSLDIMRYFVKTHNYEHIEISNFQEIDQNPLEMGIQSYIFDIDYYQNEKIHREKILLKITNHEDKTFTREDKIISMVRKFKFPTAEVMVSQESSTYLNGPFIMTRRVSTTSALDILPNYVNDKYTDSMFIHNYNELIEMLQMMNFRDDETIFRQDYSKDEWIDTLLSDVSDLFQVGSDKFNSSIQEIIAWLQQQIPELEPMDHKLINGSMHLGNIYVKDEGELYVRNWNHCRYDDPRVELASLHAYHLLFLSKQTASIIYKELLEKSKHSKLVLDILVIYYGLSIIDNLSKSFTTELWNVDERSKDPFKVLNFSNFQYFISDITGYDCPDFSILFPDKFTTSS